MAIPAQTNERRVFTLPSRRTVGWVGFYAIVVLSWIAVALMARGQGAAGNVPAEFWATLCASAAEASLPALWAMWTLMVAAMMLPTFVPALRTFTDLTATGATTGEGALALVAGYGAVWISASLLGAVAQAALARAGLLTSFGASLSLWLTAMLLVGAGLYQFSVFKEACLAKCRMPLTFFMEHWRPGASAAFGMGLRLGALCLGCCWALMALGFVGGVMNLVWMGAATLFMVLEKLPNIGRHLTRPAGWVLIIAGGVTALRATGFV